MMLINVVQRLVNRLNQCSYQIQVSTITFTLGVTFSLILTSCQTTQVAYEKTNQGTMQIKALIKDKVKNKSYVVNLKLSAILGEKMRLDVTTPIGIHLASMTLNGDNLKYILPKQSRFYDGEAKERAMIPLLSVPIDPHLIYNLAFDRPVTKKSWSCINDKLGHIESCSRLRDPLNFNWSDRNGAKKTIKIEHAKAFIQMNFNSFEKEIPNKSEIFEIKTPSGFKRIKVK